MHAPLRDGEGISSKEATSNPLVAALVRALAFCNNVIVVFAALALIAACAVLSYSVLGRALFQADRCAGRRQGHEGPWRLA